MVKTTKRFQIGEKTPEYTISKYLPLLLSLSWYFLFFSPLSPFYDPALCDTSKELAEEAEDARSKAQAARDLGRGAGGLILGGSSLLPNGPLKAAVVGLAGAVVATGEVAADQLEKKAGSLDQERVEKEEQEKEEINQKLQETNQRLEEANQKIERLEKKEEERSNAEQSESSGSGCVISSPNEEEISLVTSISFLGVSCSLLIVLGLVLGQGGLILYVRNYRSLYENSSCKATLMKPVLWWGLTFSYLVVWRLGHWVLTIGMKGASDLSIPFYIGDILLGVGSYLLFFLGLLCLFLHAPLKAFPFWGGLADLSKRFVLWLSTVNGEKAPTDVKEKVWDSYSKAFLLYISLLLIVFVLSLFFKG